MTGNRILFALWLLLWLAAWTLGAGNVSGGFYGSTYPSVVSGINKGWAITGGYLAGLHAAQDD